MRSDAQQLINFEAKSCQPMFEIVFSKVLKRAFAIV
jgi:hypothetical protein